MNQPRVRFAPSPTGALHIGGIRTALYNYLLAKKYNGSFLLRIEDTDQVRFVEGAEEYILEALRWCGIPPDEGVGVGGKFAPYRQSERKSLYKQYAEQLVAKGKAYYAFDTSEELQALRASKEANGEAFIYNSQSRLSLTNSLTLPDEEVQALLKNGAPSVIRLKINPDETVTINDLIKGEVHFQTNELDDKVLLKADGMPTYHLANIVDDHLMEITHVIRGEEWLPSTGHHVLLYQAFDWQMPAFAHLPLILKPDGKGKLSKRDGKKFGFPVFPLSWKGETEEDSFQGFREMGFDPRAVINFLALLGWNAGTDQELFSLDQLIDTFDISRINKSGAKFDFEKAKWFNHQYIIHTPNEELADELAPLLSEKGYHADAAFLARFCELYKERVQFLPDFLEKGYYFFEEIKVYDDATILKKWQPSLRGKFEALLETIAQTMPCEALALETATKQAIQEQGLKMGDVLPTFRIALAGSTQGPDVFSMMTLLGRERVLARLQKGYDYFDKLC